MNGRSENKLEVRLLNDAKALIIADLDGSFVTVNVLLKFHPKDMDKADLEDMADHINFGVL